MAHNVFFSIIFFL